MRWDVARELDQAHGLPRSSVFETLYRTGTWDAIERGRGDRQAWLAAAHRLLEERAGRPLPPLHEEWRASQRPIEPNLSLARELRVSHKLGILSNADSSLRGRLEDDMGRPGVRQCYGEVAGHVVTPSDLPSNGQLPVLLGVN